MADTVPITREELIDILRRTAEAHGHTGESDGAFERMGSAIGDAAMRRHERDTAPPNGNGMGLRTGVKPIQFDWSMNLGHVLTILTILGGFVIAYGNYTSRVAGIEQNIEAANVRAARYIPVIEASTKANDVQDERIQNLSVALQELRRVQSEQTLILGNIREDMAQVRARLSIAKPGR